MPSMAEYNAEEQTLSIKLFSILTSYTRGKCLNMVQAEKSTQDGFKLWKMLRQEFLPSTRSRSLAVAQALASYPAFPKDKSVLECIVQYERLVQEFETLSSTTYPQELKIATLITCAESKLRERLTLTITESSSYQNVRETMLSHEQASKTWNQESILRSLTLKTEGGMIRTDTGGPAPMEVDRIEDKGKGKTKSKSKGKGKWWQLPYYPNNKGNKGNKGKGKFKGKGNSKGKKGSKGKQKGKNGGKGNSIEQNQCRIRRGFGHWSRDCPRRVQQVTVVQPQQQRPAGGSVASTAPPSSTSTLNTAVRRIFHIGPPSMSSEMPSSVRMVLIQEVTGEAGQVEHYTSVILDSGSDVSLLPMCFSAQDMQATAVRLQDCQGTALKAGGCRDATLVVQDALTGEEVELRHQFIVGDVKSCILSWGELYKRGWSVAQENNGLVLKSPQGEVQIPVHYQRNSLAIDAKVCRVEMFAKAEEEFEVRAIVQIAPDYQQNRRYGVWDVEDKHPFMRTLGRFLIDPRVVWSGNFAYRTTLIQRVADNENTWTVVEVSEKYAELEEPFGKIQEIPEDEQFVILTILSEKAENLSTFGTLLDGGGDLLAPDAVIEEEEMAEEAVGQEIPTEEVHGQDVPTGAGVPTETSRRRSHLCWRHGVDGTVQHEGFEASSKVLEDSKFRFKEESV